MEAADQLMSGKGAPVDTRGPFAALVVVACFASWSACSNAVAPGSILPWTLNPTGYLSATWYIGLYFASIAAKEVMNHGVMLFLGRLCGFKRMDEGPAKVRKLEVLETVDICYLSLNTVSEFLGMNHVAAFVLLGPVETRLANFTVFNGPLAFFLILILNDIIYYPFHLIAHRRSFYPYCHKQHHRQFVPFRGYKDAANQHPLEEFYGWSIFFLCMFITSKVTGLHQGTALFTFFAWSFFNMLNHFAFDITLHLPVPFPAFVRDHQMHHRFPQCNYSTLTSMCDRFGGTFRPYRRLGEKEPTMETEKRVWYEAPSPFTQKKQETLSNGSEGEQPQKVRAEAVPSAWSVVSCGVTLCIFTLGTECAHAGTFPPLHVLGAFIRPIVVIANCAVICAAAQHALTAPTSVPENRTSLRQDGLPRQPCKAPEETLRSRAYRRS